MDGFVAQQLQNILFFVVVFAVHNIAQRRRWPRSLTYLAPFGAARSLAVLMQWLSRA